MVMPLLLFSPECFPHGKLVFVERSRLAFARQHPPWQRSIGVPLSAAVRVCALCFAPGFVPAACTAVKGPARSATGNHPPRCLPLTALPPAGMGQTPGQRGTPALRSANVTCAKPLFRRKSMDFREMAGNHRLCGLPVLRKSMDFGETAGNHRLCILPVLRKSMDFGKTTGNHRL